MSSPHYLSASSCFLLILTLLMKDTVVRQWKQTVWRLLFGCQGTNIHFFNSVLPLHSLPNPSSVFPVTSHSYLINSWLIPQHLLCLLYTSFALLPPSTHYPSPSSSLGAPSHLLFTSFHSSIPQCRHPRLLLLSFRNHFGSAVSQEHIFK